MTTTPSPLLREALDPETRFITEADKEYALGLIEDFADPDRPLPEIAAQWFCKARVENVRRVRAHPEPAARGDEAWRPIESAPRDTYKVCGPTLILGHAEKKWIRFGKWFVQERCWYYSGTNERSQYAQVRGDEPTHWMPLPSPPRAALADGGER